MPTTKSIWRRLPLLSLIAATTTTTTTVIGPAAADSTIPSSSSSSSSSSSDDELSETKLQKALDHFAMHADELLKKAVREGGGGNPLRGDGDFGDGDDPSSSSSLYVELASLALRDELERLASLRSRWDEDAREKEKKKKKGEEQYPDGRDEGHLDDNDGGVDRGYSDDDNDSEDFGYDFEYDEDDEDEDDFDFDYNYHYDYDDDEEVEFKTRDNDADDDEDGRQKRPPDEDEIEDEWEDVTHEARLKADLDPDLWWRFSYWELHAYFSCAAAFKVSRPVYDSDKWNDLRDFYHRFAETDRKDKPLRPGEGPRTFQYSNDTYDPPMIPFQAGEKGRGLKAARDISKGELVFKATNNTVLFAHGHTWRKFLFAIYERYGDDEEKGEVDSFTACDALVWSWVQALEEDGPLYIIADLDNGSLMNEGRLEDGWEPPNVRCGREGEACELAYYAMVDIREGDEILCDYREFALLNAWPAMGL
ncbi:hypothetical protein ACHAXS_004080 [Conticribra weissflogii]